MKKKKSLPPIAYNIIQEIAGRYRKANRGETEKHMGDYKGTMRQFWST